MASVGIGGLTLHPSRGIEQKPDRNVAVLEFGPLRWCARYGAKDEVHEFALNDVLSKRGDRCVQVPLGPVQDQVGIFLECCWLQRHSGKTPSACSPWDVLEVQAYKHPGPGAANGKPTQTRSHET